jgi:hypothetical protein
MNLWSNLRQHVRKQADTRRRREKLIESCKADILFYVNVFAWTYHPKELIGRPRVVPFETWPHQEETFRSILEHIDNQRDLVIEKSRDMGLSWINVMVCEWLWHFHPYTQTLMVSRVGELVDGKTPDSLFWKIDFLHKHLPEWLLPKMDRTRRHFENRDNGSTITGQATTEDIGVGGRATVAFFDEFSRVPDAYEVLSGTADTANCRIFNSTHTGPGTAFHSLTTNCVTDKLVVHWSHHPEKSRGAYRLNKRTNLVEKVESNFDHGRDFSFVLDGSPAGGPYPGLRSPWYDAECRRRGSSRAVAMDLDIDVSGSTSLFFEPLLIRRLIDEYAIDPFTVGNLSCDSRGAPKGFQRDSAGPLRLWIHLKHDGSPPHLRIAIGGDIAAGTGATPSCLSFVNRDTGEKIAEYANPNVDPKELGVMAVALARWFADENGYPALLCWEIPGPGLSFGAKVLELGFYHVYRHEKDIPVTLERVVTDKPGWTNTKKTIEPLLRDYREALATGMFVNRSKVALEECRSFRYDQMGNVEHAETASRDDPSGARVNHGDRVIADALAWMVSRRSVSRHKEQAKPDPKKDPRFILSLAGRRNFWEAREREFAES